MERFGRRKPLMIGGLWQGAWLLVFASVGTALDPTTNKAAAQRRWSSFHSAAAG